MRPLSLHLLRPLRWLLRFRHRCGYGIHSPFAFGFVTGVVYETAAYYGYERLHRALRVKRASRRPSRQLQGHGSPPPPTLREKDYRLLMRVANFAQPQRSLIHPAGDPLVGLALHLGCTHTLPQEGGGEADLIYTDAAAADPAALLDRLSEGGVLIVADTVTNTARRDAWRRVKRHPKAQVTFDLADFGIAFARTDLQRQHYLVNYF